MKISKAFSSFSRLGATVLTDLLHVCGNLLSKKALITIMKIIII